MPFSSELEQAIAPQRSEIRQLLRDWFWDGSFGLTYPALLVETFHYVKHSCSLMSRACSKLTHENREIQAYLAKHIAEEVGHEHWVLEDLEQLGFCTRAASSSPPLAETLNLIGSQLYVIDYLHPIGLLGYIYVMESEPPHLPTLKKLRELYGINERAMKFLITHGDADIQHRDELVHMLDHHVDDDQQRSAILMGATVGLANLTALLARVKSGRYIFATPLALAQRPFSLLGNLN